MAETDLACEECDRYDEDDSPSPPVVVCGDCWNATVPRLTAQRDAAYEAIRRMYESGGDAPGGGERGAWVDAFDAAMATVDR